MEHRRALSFLEWRDGDILSGGQMVLLAAACRNQGTKYENTVAMTVILLCYSATTTILTREFVLEVTSTAYGLFPDRSTNCDFIAYAQLNPELRAIVS